MLREFPDGAVVHGRCSALPLRLQTAGGLPALFERLGEDLRGCAVVLDFDKTVANDPAPGWEPREDPLLAQVRGGSACVALLARLHVAGVPLFIATARRSADKLQELCAMLEARAQLANFCERGARPAAFEVEQVRSEPLGRSFARVRGTRIYSGGTDKAPLLAHLAAVELGGAANRIVFVDDNVFNAFFVLTEAPELISQLRPELSCALWSAWWDPSVEQSRGQMRVFHDSDFSFDAAYHDCLAAFGVDERERVRTAGILAAKALLNADHL